MRLLILAALIATLGGSQPGIPVPSDSLEAPHELEFDGALQIPAAVRSQRPNAVSPAATSKPGHVLRGIASWGAGWSGVVTRLPRGTRITVTGPLGSWSGRSVGYGPAKWTGRIADLSRGVFMAICGPLSRGLCRVELRW